MKTGAFLALPKCPWQITSFKERLIHALEQLDQLIETVGRGQALLADTELVG